MLLMLLRHSCACLSQVQEASVRFADQLSSRPGQSPPLWTVLSQAPASASGDKGLTASSLQVKASPSVARRRHLVTTGFKVGQPRPLSPPHASPSGASTLPDPPRAGPLPGSPPGTAPPLPADRGALRSAPLPPRVSVLGPVHRAGVAET